MEAKIKRKTWIILCTVLAVLLACGIGGWLCYDYYTDTYITINGTVYPRNATELDLSGVAAPELDKLAQLTGLEVLDIRNTGIRIEEYEALRAALPDCAIRWSVPFQGSYYDDDTQALTVASLSDEDIALLDYLPQLTSIDAASCRDYEALLHLQEQFPGCQVSYEVALGNSTYARDTTELTLGSADLQELDRMIPHFPALVSVTFTELQTDIDGLLALVDKYPQVSFTWDMEVYGAPVNFLDAEFDISGAQVTDLAWLENLAARMPNLEKVVMIDCGFSNEEMEALNNRHEDVLFVWTVKIANFDVRTDVTYMMPWQYNRGLLLTTEQAYNLRYLTELICLDLGHNRMENIDFVAYMPKLKYLLLGDTPITDLTPLAGLEDLVFLELFMTNVTDYTPLLTLTALEDLNLCYTYGDPEVIAQMTWLDRLWWSPCLGKQPILEAALPDTLMNLTTHSSTGGLWRMSPNYYDMRDMLGMFYMTG